MASGDRADFRVRLLWVINEIEKRADVAQLEANFTSLTNEGQTLNGSLAILASAIGTSVRGGTPDLGSVLI